MSLLPALVVNIAHPEAGLVAFGPFKVTAGTLLVLLLGHATMFGARKGAIEYASVKTKLVGLDWLLFSATLFCSS